MSSEQAQQEEALKALVRVRNRLAATPDAALPPILEQLLPRLVTRFQSNNDSSLSLETEGIFAHLCDRLQLNSGIADSSWCLALLSKLASDDPDCSYQLQAYTCVLPILEIVLSRCEEISSCFEQVCCILNRLDTRLRNTTEQAYSDPFGRVKAHQLEEAWARASWMVLDCVARISGITPVLDWQKDLGDVGEVKHLSDSSLEGCWPLENVARYSNVLHSLFQHVLMFHPNCQHTLPRLSRLTKYRCEFRRRCTFNTNNTEALPHQRPSNDRLVQSGRFGRKKVTTVDTWIPAEFSHWKALQHGVLQYTTLMLGADSLDTNGIYIMITGGLPKVPKERDRPESRLLPSDIMQKMKRPRRQKDQKASAAVCSVELAMQLIYQLIGEEAYHAIVNDTITINPNMRVLPLPLGAWHRTFQFLQECHFDFTNADDHMSRNFLRTFIKLAEVAAGHADNVSMETYELIGSRIPPSLCFKMKTLSSLLKRGTPSLNLEVEKERWRCARSMLEAFRDEQVRRHRRDLVSERNMLAADMLIHRNRERIALNDPLVQNAIQMRIEAYSSVAAYAPHVSLLTANGELCWDVAFMSLNCAVHDTRSEVSYYLQKACIVVLESYKAISAEKASNLQLLYMPIQQACSSSETWVRSLGYQWASNILEKYDPLFTRVVFTCMIHDEDETIATASLKSLSDAPYWEQPPIPFARFVNVDSVNNEVMADLHDRIKSIQKFGGLDNDAAFLCLRENSFSVEKSIFLLENMTDQAPRATDSTAMETKDRPADAFCGVCFDSVKREKIGSLPCFHYFCQDCWSDAVDVAVSDGGLASLVGLCCLQHDCSEKVTSQVLRLLAPKWAPQWQSAMLESFVKDCERYCSCPQSKCTSVAVLPDNTFPVTSASCTLCNTTFCPTCGEGAHSPVPCKVLRDYQAESNRWDAITNEIENRIQECPRCSQRIQKNGGCNHMTCTACGHEFCWLCLSADWASHVCRSNLNWDAPSSDGKFGAVRQLVLNHEHSEINESRRLENFNEFVNGLPTKDFWTDTEVSVLKDASNELLQARKFLKFACVSLYGLFGTKNEQEVVREFDEKRSDLQRFVERLNYVVDSVRTAANEETLMTLFRAFRFCKAAIPLYEQRLKVFVAKCYSEYAAISDNDLV